VTAHACRLSDPWPTGHPLPPEDPAKLEGPEEGSFMLYRKDTPKQRVVRVIHRSYVWSPGECRRNGGYRHYDWSVIEEGPEGYRSVVVNDSELSPIPASYRVITSYSLKER
jgi:hypothetical protein